MSLPREHVETLATKFLEKCGGQQECKLTRKALAEFAGVQTKFYTDRLFTLINKSDQNETITFSDFISFVERYAEGSTESKTELLFKIYDTNGDGQLDKKELMEMLRVSLKENNYVMDEELLDECVMNLLAEGISTRAENQDQVFDAEVDPKSTLQLQDFRNLFDRVPELIQNLSTIIEKWLQPIKRCDKPTKGCGGIQYSKKCRNLMHWMENNAVYVSWISIFYFLNTVLFVARILIFYAEDDTNNPDPPIFLALARGFGFCLDFSSSFILLTMMRLSLTKLRYTPLANTIIPLDDHKQFHRMVGQFIVVLSLGHTISHLINIKITLKNQTMWSYVEYLFNMEVTRTLGLIKGFAYISEFIIILILLTMFFFTFDFVRRNGYFHAFYISHIVCYPLFYLFMVLHSKNFWKWFIFPGIVFAIEQIVRIYYNFFAFRTTIKMGIILPSKVTNLVINRPPGFNFSPGDFLFINLPHLSRFEWHAFTISSAPENWDELSLHIRAVGPWTKNLYNFYNHLKTLSEFKLIHPDGKHTEDYTKLSKLSLKSVRQSAKSSLNDNKNRRKSKRIRSRIISQESNTTGESSIRQKRAFTIHTVDNYRYQARRPESVVIFGGNEEIPTSQVNQVDGQTQNHLRNNDHNCDGAGNQDQQLPDNYTQIIGQPLKAYIDGPYGAPCSEIFRTEHAVLIGAGIGVTPFASILQSIMYRHWATKIGCPSCNVQFSHGFLSNLAQLQKVDFFWLNPEQNAFSWFLNLLSKLEIEQEELGGELDHFLDIHMYMTKALQRNDMKAVALQLALDLFYEKNKRDCLAKLKTRMNAGRPDWETVFSKIKSSKKGAVSIFFCGPKPLGNQLRQLCAKYEFAFKTESF